MSDKVYKTTCFAYHNGKCSALSFANCKCCKFFKTRKENDEQDEKSFIRSKLQGYYDERTTYQPYKRSC